MTAELTTEEHRRIEVLWEQWRATKRPNDALFFEFHDRIIVKSEDLQHITLVQTLGVLVPYQTLSATKRL